MNVIFAGETYKCTRAVKDGNKATLYLEEGGTVEFSGVNDWGAFSIEGGEWEAAPPSEADRIAALEGALLACLKIDT